MPRTEFVSLAGLRVDGRRPGEVRKLRCRLGLFGRADGSAYLELGNTKVVAVVYGPKHMRRRAEAQHDKAVINCEYSVAPFAGSERKKVRSSDRRVAEASLLLQQVFEGVVQRHLYARSQIDIFVHVLQGDGGERATAINAATLALIDAGIAMDDFVVACTAGYLDDTPLLDLNFVETGPGGPRVEVAMVPRSGKLASVQMESRIPLDHFEPVMELAVEGCRHIFDVLQAAVREHTLKRLDTRGVLPG